MVYRHSLLNRCHLFHIKLPLFHPVRHSSSNLKSPHNQAIIDLLLKYKRDEENKPNRNNHKVYAFAKAIHAILQFDRPIRSGNDILQLRGIGPGITSRINDHLLETQTSLPEKEPEIYQEIVNQRSAATLKDFPGIGPITAKKLLEAGCRSLEDLKSGKFDSLLSAKKVVKIKYMGNLECTIQRKQAEEVLEFCKEILGPPYELTLVDEYRRGSITLSEIKIMLSHPEFVHIPPPTDPPLLIDKSDKSRAPKQKKGDKTNILHNTVIPLLQRCGLLAEDLSSDITTWEGVVRLPGPHGTWGDRVDRVSAIQNMDGDFRKISIHLIPKKSEGSSLIALTGDREFEKDVCYRAKQRGMLFNQHGLWKWITNSPQSISPLTSSSTDPSTGLPASNTGLDLDTGYWSLLKSSTETEIFRELEMTYVDPTRRNFSFISGKARSSNRIGGALHIPRQLY